MSRFNIAAPSPKLVVNNAGGQAYQQSPQLQLVSLLLTSFVKDSFYQKETDQMDRLKALISQCDPLFVAKAIIYARKEFGMRTISHIGAVELGKYISGKPWAKSFYNKVIHRVDDMTEILAYYIATQGRKLPNSLKKGIASAFDRFDNYQLAKYKAESKSMKLVDVVNMVHPVPVDKNAEALRLLIGNALKNTDTWESKLSDAGQKASSEEEKAEFKKEAWNSLIKERKIGYFALLRNLRNILTQAPDLVGEAASMLTDEGLIKKSLVLPFRFLSALDEISPIAHDSKGRALVSAISKAIDISVGNFPKFAGETLVVLDCSGSMDGKPKRIGSLFAAALAKVNNSDVLVFGSSAGYVQGINYSDSLSSIASALEKFSLGGTDYRTIFHSLNKRYDRIIILSDGEAWMGYKVASPYLNEYKNKFNKELNLFNFDLAGNGTMQFPEANTFCLAGFSDKTLELIQRLEQDKQALIREIERIEL